MYEKKKKRKRFASSKLRQKTNREGVKREVRLEGEGTVCLD
jgi:hypothetical protein